MRSLEIASDASLDADDCVAHRRATIPRTDTLPSCSRSRIAQAGKKSVKLAPTSPIFSTTNGCDGAKSKHVERSEDPLYIQWLTDEQRKPGHAQWIFVSGTLLIAPYSVRSERQFCEHLDYNLL
jgi:hypothetical protein